jgi:hypothetical protein
VPDVASDPLQLPDAVQDVAFVELHVSVLLPPLPTDIGDADSETVGAGVEPPDTVTVVLACAVRPLPLEHVSVYVRDTLNAPVLWLPEVALSPLQPPDAVQDAARLLDHVSVLLPPAFTELGLADSDTVGARQYCA